MIRAKKRLVAVLGGAAVVAGVLFVSPAQAAMSCQSIPGQTIGTDVKVGSVQQRVPAIANIKLCYGTGTVPVASVSTVGGTCTSNCLTVTVGGGAVDLEGVSLSWTEDGVLKSTPVNPTPVDGVDGTCVISVGMPDAPNPDCFIAIGPDDPTGLTAPVLATVNTAVTTAFELVGYGGQVAGQAVEDGGQLAGDTIDDAGQLADAAYEITCDAIPDRSGYDFCSDPNGWVNESSNYYYYYACDRVPAMQGDYYWEQYYFCDDPVAWTNALLDNYSETVNDYYWYTCDQLGYAYDPRNGGYYYACDDAAGWASAVVYTWCGSLCDASTEEYLDMVRQLLRNIEIS